MKTNPLYHMKNVLLAANWKSNKTKFEAKNWLEEVSAQSFGEGLEVVILAPFTLLDTISGYIRVNDFPFKLGAQDVSPFDDGAYTGEVSARQIKEFADYVLIGHSERRTNFGESDEMVRKKVERAIAQELKPIVCISDLSQVANLKFDQELIIAYEPLEAIGTGKPQDPDSVEFMANQIRAKMNATRIIYGGSVNADNLRDYINLDGIEGALVGGESLNSSSFIDILKNAI